MSGVASHEDGAGFEAIEDPARQLFGLPDPWSHLRTQSDDPDQLLDTAASLEHEVPLGGGDKLRLHEVFTLGSWLRWPKRAVLFLSGTAVTANGWTIPVEGYNGPEAAARRGMFAFTADFIGVGGNYRPGMDAAESTFERNLEALETIVRYIRYFRSVPEIDLVGESWGGAMATQLAADTTRVRSCTMSSMSYKAVGNPVFTSPEFVAMLESLPDNYLPSNPAMLEPEMAGAPQEVKTYIFETQTGPRLTNQLRQFIEGLPHFDPGVARVPGLVISGHSESADGHALAADYGTAGAEFFELDDGHVQRFRSPATAKAYWDRIFEFIRPQGIR